MLSRAVVPPQNFGRRGAVIRIQVVEGYVDQVIWPVEKLARYRDFFTDYTARIVADRPANIRTLERYLLLANDLPGLKFSTSLKPSATNPNASTLIVEVKEKTFEGVARIDNRGTIARGPWQYLGALTINNLAALARGVHRDLCGDVPVRGAAVRRGELPAGAQQRGADGVRHRELRRRQAGHRVPAACSTTAPAARSFDAGLAYPVIRSRETNLTLTGLGFLTNDDSFVLGQPFTHDRLRGFRLKADGDWADSFLGINQVNVTFSQGFHGLGSPQHANPDNPTPVAPTPSPCGGSTSPRSRPR